MSHSLILWDLSKLSHNFRGLAAVDLQTFFLRMIVYPD